MIWLVAAIAIIYFAHYSEPTFAHPPQKQNYLGSGNIRIRPAVEDDLDDLTTVVVDAFRPGPIWQYVSQGGDRYKDYRWKCTRRGLGEEFSEIEETDFWNVISVPATLQTGETRNGRSERVVAFASWQFVDPSDSEFKIRQHSKRLPTVRPQSKSCADLLDVNMTRYEDFDRQMTSAMIRYIVKYPKKQFYLGLLATHPDWDGHSFGAAHCRWGMDMVKETDVPITLLATPAGFPLYDQLGFDSLANITFRTLDWKTNLWEEYMRYES